MTEIVRVIRRDFDSLENRSADAVSDVCVGTFIGNAKLTAQGVAKEWLSEQPPVRLYLGWDGNVYPQFRIEKELAYGGKR